MSEMSPTTKNNAIHTALSYHQGNIAGLDDAMTRRLVASTVGTESGGGNLTVTNRQGYVGRYQAGAAWLAEAGYVDEKKLHQAMKQDGYKNEWNWATHGGMTKFLNDPSNWKHGLSLEQYKGSADLQDKAFKTASDNAYHQAIKEKVLTEHSNPKEIAGFLKARHISGYGDDEKGAVAAIKNRQGAKDINGTSNLTYYHHLAHNTDKLDEPFNKAYAQFKQTGHVPPAPTHDAHPSNSKSTPYPTQHKEKSDDFSLSHLYQEGKKALGNIADKLGMSDHPAPAAKTQTAVHHDKAHQPHHEHSPTHAKHDSHSHHPHAKHHAADATSLPRETPTPAATAISEKAQQLAQQAERQLSSLNQNNQLGFSNEDIRQIAGKVGTFAHENKANQLDYVYIGQNNQTGEKIVSAQFDGFKDFRQPAATAIAPEQIGVPVISQTNTAPQVERSANSRCM